MKELIAKYCNTQTETQLFGFGLITIISILAGVSLNQPAFLVIPVALLIVYIALVDFKKLFWFLLFALPISTEIDVPGGLTIDLPDEPLMMALMGLYFIYALKPNRDLNNDLIRHPITIILLVHLGWIFTTAFTSQIQLVSFKFFAAKLWYIVTFFFLTVAMIKSKADWKTFFWVIAIPLILTVIYVLIRHYGEGFSLKSINKMVRPFYRNHVNYACLLVLFMPFMWYALKWYRRFSVKWWAIVGGMIILILGIQFSYTRAAYVALFGAIGASYIIEYKLVKPTLISLSIVTILGIFYIVGNNNYLRFAPDYDSTITHESFGNLLSATTKGQDVSTMERVYRWVAAGHMVAERPLLGFGPGNFPRHYKSYAVSNFKTYVSDNEEQSGVHNYFFTVTTEQGIIGLLIFVSLCFVVLIQGEKIYHETKEVFNKRIVMSVMLSFIIILMLLLMNDLIETDKVGTFFFMAMALMVKVDLDNKKVTNKLTTNH